MAQAEWTKYFTLDEDTFWGLEQYKDKLPKTPEEESLLKRPVMAIFTDTGNYCIYDPIQKRWY